MTTLIGYGAHGKDIEQIWLATHPEPLKLCDDDPATGWPIPHRPDAYLLGPYYPRQRAAMAIRLDRAGWKAAIPLLHPSVEPGTGVVLGAGVVIARNAVLDHSVILGVHTHVNYAAAMTRCEVGNFCTISPGAVICGDVKIGHRVFIGAGAVIINLLQIGDDAVIGAGTVVRHNVAQGQVVL